MDGMIRLITIELSVLALCYYLGCSVSSADEDKRFRPVEPYGECISMRKVKQYLSPWDETELEAKRCLEKKDLVKAKILYRSLIEGKVPNYGYRLVGWDGLANIYYLENKPEMADACKAYAIEICRQESTAIKELLGRLWNFATSNVYYGKRTEAIEAMNEYNRLLDDPKFTELPSELKKCYSKMSLKELDRYRPVAIKENKLELEVLEGSVKVNGKKLP